MNEQELYHYGVKGMRWGVKRAKKAYETATTNEGRQKAINSLERHRDKATKKLVKLENQHAKLQVKSDKLAKRNDIKAAKMKRKATKATKKAYTGFRSNARREQLKFKGERLNALAEEKIAKTADIKAKIAKNEVLTRKFNEGINDIDMLLVERGRKYLEGN